MKKSSLCLYVKSFVLFLLLLAVSLPAAAQVRYGFRFGGDFTKASLSNDVNGARLDNRSGFSGGLVLEYQLPKCGFAPDIALLYTRFNTRIVFPGENPHSFGRNFIEVPLHLKYKFWLPQTHNLFAPMIYTGPSLMFRLDHNDGATSSPISSVYPSYTFATKTFQPGWDVGIGFDIVNFIQVSAGYRFGLGNTVKSTSPGKLHTNAWNLSATLLFDF